MLFFFINEKKKNNKKNYRMKTKKEKKSDELDALKIVMFVRFFSLIEFGEMHVQFFLNLSRIFNSE